MRNQSASAVSPCVTHGQTTPTSSRHCRRHLRCVCVCWAPADQQQTARAATVRVLVLSLAQTQTQHRLQFSLDRPPRPRPSARRRQPVRHNEHHCVLSAFVVSCSCEPPPCAGPIPRCSFFTAAAGQAGCLFILFLVPASVRLHFWHRFAMYFR